MTTTYVWTVTDGTNALAQFNSEADAIEYQKTHRPSKRRNDLYGIVRSRRLKP